MPTHLDTSNLRKTYCTMRLLSDTPSARHTYCKTHVLYDTPMTHLQYDTPTLCTTHLLCNTPTVRHNYCMTHLLYDTPVQHTYYKAYLLHDIPTVRHADNTIHDRTTRLLYVNISTVCATLRTQHSIPLYTPERHAYCTRNVPTVCATSY